MSAPGWYPDPTDASALRFWDGMAWTTHVRSAATGQPPAPPPPAQHAPATVAASNDALVMEASRLRNEIAGLQQELALVRAELVEANDLMLLQEVGLYEYAHPLADSMQYRERLEELDTQINAMVKAGTAISGTNKWAVNGSAKDGAKMVSDFQKLMLRTYNNEAENVARTIKPYSLAPAVARLDKARTTIKKLGAIMKVEITEPYHRLRVTELELTADYAAKLAEEREREREERARLREEEAARKEIEREKEKLEKEKHHYEALVEALAAKPNVSREQLAQAQAKVIDVQKAIDGVTERAANTRAGYVYVISNHGAFGERVVKIGMTRRLDPMDRVRELGDASVPFRFDVHAIMFSDDAVGLEGSLHARFAQERVNLVNAHREFFYVRPGAVREVLREVKGDLLSFVEHPEALEWRQSETLRGAKPGTARPAQRPAES